MPSVGDLLTVRIVALLDAQPIINVYSFDLISPELTWSATAQALVDALDAALGVVTGGGFWTAGRSEAYVVQAVEVIDIKPGTSPLYSGERLLGSGCAGRRIGDHQRPGRGFRRSGGRGNGTLVCLAQNGCWCAHCAARGEADHVYDNSQRGPVAGTSGDGTSDRPKASAIRDA